MNSTQIFEESGLFLNEPQTENSELKSMLTNAQSPLFAMMQNALENGNEIILIKNWGNSSLFPNGITAGLLLHETRTLSCKTVLDFLSLKRTHFPTQFAQNYYYSDFYYGYSGHKQFLSVSRYSAKNEKLHEEIKKIAEIQTYLPFSFARITPRFDTDGVFSHMQVESYSVSNDLYQLKRGEQFLRSTEGETEEYFFQASEVQPILESLSKLEIPILDDESHRSVRNREHTTQKSMGKEK